VRFTHPPRTASRRALPASRIEDSTTAPKGFHNLEGILSPWNLVLSTKSGFTPGEEPFPTGISEAVINVDVRIIDRALDF
jgi:hypothetical protein